MSKRAGAVSADTRQAILLAARKEFAARGFRGSSLRRICAGAGVTTGAIYFFFTGKDQLFETVLSSVTEPFSAYMRGHYASERQAEGQTDNAREDFAISLTLIDFYFQNRETWDILLHHMDHPAVRSFLDRFIEESTEHYLYRWSRANSGEPDRFAIAQFSHMQADTMLTLISQDFDREEMIRHSRTVTKMLRGAFLTLMDN